MSKYLLYLTNRTATDICLDLSADGTVTGDPEDRIVGAAWTRPGVVEFAADGSVTGTQFVQIFDVVTEEPLELQFFSVAMPAVGESVWITPASEESSERVVTKLVSRVRDQAVSDTDLIGLKKAGISQSIDVEKPDGSPWDLSGKTLEFVLFRGQTETEINRVDTVIISGAGNNTLTWTVPASMHQIVGEHSWAIREPSADQKVWAKGAYSIEYVAGPHV